MKNRPSRDQDNPPPRLVRDGRPAADAGDAGASKVYERRGVVDRRASGPTTGGSDLARRRGAGRRLSDFTRSAEEGEMNREQFLFLVAIDEFKRANAKHYPNWTDVLEVLRLLGYRKTMPSELRLARAEDWREAGDAPANVRAPRWNERAA